MEPITLSASFASIVGLLGTYRSENRSVKQDDFNNFMMWLTKSNHSEVKEFLEVNTQATIGIKALLNQDREQLFQKLEALDEVISTIASRIDGFSEVTTAIYPNSELSEQAVSILRQLLDSEGSKFLKSEALGIKPQFLILDGKGGNIEYDEPQFIDDDINTLIDIGLLKVDYNSRGNRLYVITRAAVKFLNAIS